MAYKRGEMLRSQPPKRGTLPPVPYCVARTVEAWCLSCLFVNSVTCVLSQPGYRGKRKEPPLRVYSYNTSNKKNKNTFATVIKTPDIKIWSKGMHIHDVCSCSNEEKLIRDAIDPGLRVQPRFNLYAGFSFVSNTKYGLSNTSFELLLKWHYSCSLYVIKDRSVDGIVLNVSRTSSLHLFIIVYISPLSFRVTSLSTSHSSPKTR
jgi:hypothetical protein